MSVVLFEATVNKWGSRLRIFEDRSILLDNPTVLVHEVPSGLSDFFYVGDSVRTQFTKQNVEKVEFLQKIGKPPYKLLAPFLQNSLEKMKTCYWRKEGTAIKITLKKILYIEEGKPKQEFKNVELVISIDEPVKMLEKLNELGFPCVN